MKAAVYHKYGAPEVVSVTEMPTPAPGPEQVLIRVHASSVTTADWRLRASAFPGILWLPGRLMMGLTGPRKPVLGLDLAGEVVATGHAVTRFAVGQRVFGFAGGGGHAEYAVLSQDAALVEMPEDMRYDEAAALPFGAVCALIFLRDVASVQSGQRVLILGGSGGVGVYAIQIAKALGAHVTASASAEKADLMQALGADAVQDYRRDPADAGGPFDLIFDAVGATDWRGARKALRKSGLFLPLNFKGRDIWHMLRSKCAGGPRMVLHVNGDSAETLRDLLALRDKGQLRPVIDRHFALDDIRAAHAYVEARRRKGAVIVDVIKPEDTQAVA